MYDPLSHKHCWHIPDDLDGDTWWWDNGMTCPDHN